jgi:hypothetical protein
MISSFQFFWLKLCCTSHLSQAPYMPHPSYPSWFGKTIFRYKGPYHANFSIPFKIQLSNNAHSILLLLYATRIYYLISYTQYTSRMKSTHLQVTIICYTAERINMKFQWPSNMNWNSNV